MRKLPTIIPVTDFRQDAAAALERVRKSGEPVIITQRGRSAAVMMSVEAFERAEREREELRERLLRTRAEESGEGKLNGVRAPNLPAIMDALRANRPLLDRYAVREASVFGSVARGTAGPESDVDLLVEFDRPVGLLEFVGLQNELRELLGRPVDLVTQGGLRPGMRERVLAEAVRAG